MSWETTLLSFIDFHRQTFDSMHAIEEAMDECNSLIRLAKEDLFALATATDGSIFLEKDSECTVFDALRAKFHNAIDILEEELPKLNDLYKIKENFEKAQYTGKDGKKYFKPIPKNISWDDAFIDGDFIPHEEEVDEEGEIGCLGEIPSEYYEFLKSLPSTQFTCRQVTPESENQLKAYQQTRAKLLHLAALGYLEPKRRNKTITGYLLTQKAYNLLSNGNY